MKSLKKKVLSTIERNRNEIVNFLKQLVKIPSVTESGHHEREIQATIADRLRQAGYSVDAWEPDLDQLKTHPAYTPVHRDFKNRPMVVGVLRGSGRGRSIILNGHSDVVSPEPLKHWKYDPWCAISSGNRIIGRGSSDMKGGIVAMIMAVESVIDSGIELDGDVVVESVLNEEIGGTGTLACVLRGYKADGAIIAEPTDLELHLAHRGGRFFRISIKGKSAHVGFKQEGVSALEKGIKILESLKNLEEQREKSSTHVLFERYSSRTPICVGIMKSGEWPCTVPEDAVIEGTIECLPGENIVDVSNDLEQYLDRVVKNDRWLREHKPNVEWPTLCIESSETSRDHPLALSVKESYEEITGEMIVYGGFPGGCDMRLLTKYANTPTVLFGPGSLKQAHSINEFLSTTDLMESVKIIALCLMKWCGVE